VKSVKLSEHSSDGRVYVPPVGGATAIALRRTARSPSSAEVGRTVRPRRIAGSRFAAI